MILIMDVIILSLRKNSAIKQVNDQTWQTVIANAPPTQSYLREFDSTPSSLISFTAFATIFISDWSRPFAVNTVFDLRV